MKREKFEKLERKKKRKVEVGNGKFLAENHSLWWSAQSALTSQVDVLACLLCLRHLHWFPSPSCAPVDGPGGKSSRG